MELICRPSNAGERRETEHWAPGTFAFIEYGDCRHAIEAVKFLHGKHLQDRIIECELTHREMNIEVKVCTVTKSYS